MKMRLSDRTDNTYWITNIPVLLDIIGEFHISESPEVPVGKFLEKLLVQFGCVECLAPSVVKFNKVREPVFVLELIAGKIQKYLYMSTVRV
ncbi:MAG: hypothetical protein MZU97_14905 [Bacillus subtilis]|nr:hypothetical protein [Bacillus subtilis]